MKGYKRILLYADPKAQSEPVLQSAAGAAKHSQGVVTVVDCLPNWSPQNGVSRVPCELRGMELESARHSLAQRETCARLNQFCQQLRAQGVEATAKILTGQPVREIIHEVQHNGHDIVMKTAQGDRKVKEKGFFGTTTTALMRKAPCPVWIDDPGRASVPKRILAAIDPSTDDSETIKLNVKVVDHAAELAESIGARLYVLYAWRALGESLFWRAQMSTESLQNYIKDARRYANREIASLLARCNKRISPSNVHLVKGDPSEVISDFALQRRIDLIVMGTVGRTGLSGLVIGNTAEQVLRRVHCSVLTIPRDALRLPARANDRVLSQIPEPHYAATLSSSQEQTPSETVTL